MCYNVIEVASMTNFEMKKHTCCFSGHRRIPKSEILNVKQRLRGAIISAIKNGYCFFGTGGALGFDTLAAQTVLDLKKKYPEIRLILVLPCLSQTKNWQAVDISEYERIKKNADKVVYTSKKYTRDCMFKRNRHLIDNSSLCVCYLKEQSGGTVYTVTYAKAHGLNIHNIAL